MVLELLINPKKITGKPWEMIFLGFTYSFIAAFLALWIFKSYVSIVMVTLTIVASIPVVREIIESEEKKDLHTKKKFHFLKVHKKAILSLVYLFIGFTLAFVALYMFFPSSIVEKIFNAQLETIITVKSSPAGKFFSPFPEISSILFNNIKILIFCIAFSFFYGAGAIFILTWNSSVMAAAIGSFIKNNLLNAQGVLGYIQITTLGFLQYMLHGIPEIIAYFIGALASGMISFALMRHDFMDKNFKVIIKDSMFLIFVAIIFLFLAALIEVFITPLIM